MILPLSYLLTKCNFKMFLCREGKIKVVSFLFSIDMSKIWLFFLCLISIRRGGLNPVLIRLFICNFYVYIVVKNSSFDIKMIECFKKICYLVTNWPYLLAEVSFYLLYNNPTAPLEYLFSTNWVLCPNLKYSLLRICKGINNSNTFFATLA